MYTEDRKTLVTHIQKTLQWLMPVNERSESVKTLLALEVEDLTPELAEEVQKELDGHTTYQSIVTLLKKFTWYFRSDKAVV